MIKRSFPSSESEGWLLVGRPPDQGILGLEVREQDLDGGGGGGGEGVDGRGGGVVAIGAKCSDTYPFPSFCTSGNKVMRTDDCLHLSY